MLIPDMVVAMISEVSQLFFDVQKRIAADPVISRTYTGSIRLFAGALHTRGFADLKALQLPTDAKTFHVRIPSHDSGATIVQFAALELEDSWNAMHNVSIALIRRTSSTGQHA